MFIVIECDYRRVLDWRPDLLDTLLQGVTTIWRSLLHTQQCPHSSLHHRCLVADSKGRCSPSPGFPTGPRPQLPDSNINRSQLITISGHGERRKYRFSGLHCCCVRVCWGDHLIATGPFSSNGCLYRLHNSALNKYAKLYTFIYFLYWVWMF